MAILTENKVRQLLRTTDLKKTKLLLLEPGTIITPAAKGYLTGITIHYGTELETELTQQKKENSEVADPVSSDPVARTEGMQMVAGNQITWGWNISVQKLIGHVLVCQAANLRLGKEELVHNLEQFITVLKDLQQLRFCKENWAVDPIDSEAFQIEYEKRETVYLVETYIPSYSEGETVVSLYQLFTQTRELQLAAYNQLQTYLLFEDFYSLVEGCRWLSEYSWLLMIREIEGNKKGRRA